MYVNCIQTNNFLVFSYTSVCITFPTLQLFRAAFLCNRQEQSHKQQMQTSELITAELQQKCFTEEAVIFTVILNA